MIRKLKKITWGIYGGWSWGTGSIVYLTNPGKYSPQDDFYFRMNFGIEF